jgi:hypothetical protein
MNWTNENSRSHNGSLARHSEIPVHVKSVPFIATGLAALCVSLAILIGDIGFQGDDWWQFSWPYWYPFPDSIWEYTKASKRPVEGIYTVLTFELFGFNRIFYTISALSLSAGACLLMGICLKRAFLHRESLIVMAVAFAFLLPTASNLIYMFHTDNSRLSVLLFWASVWCFQRWAEGSKSWPGLLVPLVVYWVATFTYENTTFLIFAVPLLVWPIHVRFRKGVSNSIFLLRTFIGIIAGFSIFVLARFVVFSGGAVGHRSLFPPITLIWSYLCNLAWFCLYPFCELCSDPLAWAWGLAAATTFTLLLHRASKGEPHSQTISNFAQSSIYIAGLGFALLALGLLPYLMAGYDPPLGFTSQSRVYSSGSFGLAILLAVLLHASVSRSILRVKHAFAIALILVMAAFLAGLRNDWLQAAGDREKLCASLLRLVPNVSEGTTLLFWSLQSYVSDRGVDEAVIFQGVDGLGEFVKMFYNNKNLHAYFLYSWTAIGTDPKGRIASVSPKGLTARGSAVRPPIPLDSLLILKRDGNRMILLDKLSPEDKDVAIEWNGVSEIKSNSELILSAQSADGRFTGAIEKPTEIFGLTP